MVAERRLDDTADLALLQGESSLFERRHHLPAAERAQVPALVPGGILGQLAGESGEIAALAEFGENLLRLLSFAGPGLRTVLLAGLKEYMPGPPLFRRAVVGDIFLIPLFNRLGSDTSLLQVVGKSKKEILQLELRRQFVLFSGVFIPGGQRRLVDRHLRDVAGTRKRGEPDLDLLVDIAQPVAHLLLGEHGEPAEDRHHPADEQIVLYPLLEDRR